MTILNNIFTDMINHPLNWLVYLLIWQIISSLLAVLLSKSNNSLFKFLLAIDYSLFGALAIIFNHPTEAFQNDFRHHYDPMLILARRFGFITTITLGTFLLACLGIRLLTYIGVLVSGIAMFGLTALVLFIFFWVVVVVFLTNLVL